MFKCMQLLFEMGWMREERREMERDGERERERKREREKEREFKWNSRVLMRSVLLVKKEYIKLRGCRQILRSRSRVNLMEERDQTHRQRGELDSVHCCVCVHEGVCWPSYRAEDPSRTLQTFPLDSLFQFVQLHLSVN